MIKKSFSVTLSMIMTCVMAAIVFALCFALPRFSEWYYGFTIQRTAVLWAFYSCVPAAACAVYLLIRLLLSIRKGDVFTTDNVSRLRGLSWCCMFVTAAALVTGCFYYSLLIVCAAAGFMAIILRVVKNAFAYACDIKNENELTI